MEFATPLIPARLIRRYKRFLADVVLPDGSEAVAHAPILARCLAWRRKARGSGWNPMTTPAKS